MTQTSTTAPAIASLTTLAELDERIAKIRRRLSAGRGNQKLTNERMELMNSLQAQRKGLCALLSIGELAQYVRDTHDALMAHKGAGKMLIVARRGDAIRDFKSALIGREYLTESATDPDALELAQGKTTVAAVNQRYAELLSEAEAEDMQAEETEADAAQETGISDFAKAQIGALVKMLITEADDRDAHIEPTRAALNAHRDAMRDLRDELARLGLLER